MIELPEARAIAKDLQEAVLGKTIIDVSGNYTDHKFTFYYQNPHEYKSFLRGKKITKINMRNYYIELEIEDYTLTMRDGANIRYYAAEQPMPKKSKLLLLFTDGSFINITVAMYAFIAVFRQDVGMDDKYYNKELNGIGVLDEKYTFTYFKSLINDTTKKLSAKAFLATQQRILGIGNGVVQDILFNAKIHPKKKINVLSSPQLERLYNSSKDTVAAMVEQGGRDTEKDIYGEYGRYKTILSSKSYKNGKCPICQQAFKKENYLGGSIYYCEECQPHT
jgi:formamidopyrimidine-DNA glycosylase